MLGIGSTKVGRCALARALLYVGTREDPPGSNRGPLIDQWNHEASVPKGSAWCMAFARAMFSRCGVTLGGWASVGNFIAWAAAHGYEIVRPWKGCLVCYDWQHDHWADHVEIVKKVRAIRWRGGRFVGWIETVGGNTGDMVRVQRRWVSTDTRFARIPDQT